MNSFTATDSIVRRIWGQADVILFIFGGAAAEFALNKAVDWLYFTGRLPQDPLGRLFSTVAYAREIIFMEEDRAHATIDRIRMIHSEVEQSRQALIPDEAYRDVLFMLIHYSISAYETLERKLSMEEREEVFRVFYKVGARMQLKDLPQSYTTWLEAREQHLLDHLSYSNFTRDLFRQYRRHLGYARYQVLLQAQQLVIPPLVRILLLHNKSLLLRPALGLYRRVRHSVSVRNMIPHLLPAQYYPQLKALNILT
jgi:hypothetical protein